MMSCETENENREMKTVKKNSWNELKLWRGPQRRAWLCLWNWREEQKLYYDINVSIEAVS